MFNDEIRDGDLQLSTDAMRTLGYRVVDLLVDHVEGLSEQNIGHVASRPEMESLLRESLPWEGADPLHVLGEAREKVLAHIMHLDHPRFFGFIPGPGNFVGVMADALASGFNVFTGSWLEAAGPAEVELVTIDWLRELCGFPRSGGGLFTSGGSTANLTALCVARHIKLGDDAENAVVYCSDQTHSSIERALRMMGFRREQLRKLSSDKSFRLDVDLLRATIAEDRRAGLRPFCVVANPGTTNTGAVDPLPELASLCREQDLWLHADGAYGAAAVFCEEGRAALRGIDKVDSLSFDPHKWLFQPYEIGCVLVRETRWLKDTFHILPEYLETTRDREDEVNFADLGPQLTRSFRALKLWMSLKTFGASAFAQAIRRGLELARVAESMLEGQAGWCVMTAAQMGIVTFRYVPDDVPEHEIDALNEALVDALMKDGTAMVSSTRLRGRTVLRLCPINPRTTERDIRQTLERMDELARQRLPSRGHQKW